MTEIALGIALSLCLFSAFIIGLRMGLRLSKGKEPKTPVQMVREAKERKQIEERQQQEEDEMAALMAVDGYTEEERKLIYKDGG